MKKISLLPLIAFIFLCSCKSSSFMAQRYTKLGHKHHSAKNEKLVVKNTTTFQKSQAPPIIQTEQTENPALVATVSNNESLSAGVKPVFLPKKLIQPLVTSGKNALTTIHTDYKKAKSENIGQEKTFKQKAHRAAGLFNTVFKIVLFAIILAILVAVIIIIVLT